MGRASHADVWGTVDRVSPGAAACRPRRCHFGPPFVIGKGGGGNEVKEVKEVKAENNRRVPAGTSNATLEAARSGRSAVGATPVSAYEK